MHRGTILRKAGNLVREPGAVPVFCDIIEPIGIETRRQHGQVVDGYAGSFRLTFDMPPKRIASLVSG